MRVALLAIFVSLVPLASGCGGTSSETPWPHEPEGKTLGPAGESGPAENDDTSARSKDDDTGTRAKDDDTGARAKDDDTGARAKDDDAKQNAAEP
jgi:hypothetical protein